MYSCHVMIRVSDNSVGDVLQTFASVRKPMVVADQDFIRVTADENGKPLEVMVRTDLFVSCLIQKISDDTE